ncbi:(2Fe-2S)-binding protein [Amycolatopsis sp. PS_44_ISF1]|uniref:(2Fe-2S)-binding protein n=1 Tax=Amycolatopsis sp. PS_44_ISF1 TaxID=2974917 RepID=UPI0028DF0635|nr:(2Fe-2S)-binding protein [Amycolatopsis sp. PS_44_ISF1]MDT8915495.1 (2Fe-2S)-binding protein [Amycolatopsis sp. PS_44_ISF1]
MTSASLLADASWVRAHVDGAAKLYGRARAEVLGTIWWYSLSSVLVAPTVESLEGVVMDPSLEAVELDLAPDGRFLAARSLRTLQGPLGEALAGSLGPAIATIASVTGANPRALGAIATDSIANRLLWASAPERAEELVASIGLRLPKPRYVTVGRTLAVKRTSCCLIYEAGNTKCVSCPRQKPAEREARLRAALG